MSAPLTPPEGRKICPMCLGHKVIPVSQPLYLEARYFNCPRCHGTGLVPVAADDPPKGAS